MDGYELADWVNGRKDLADLPVVALTATPLHDISITDQKKFRDVLIKFDRKTLADGLQAIMSEVMRQKPFQVEGEVISSQSVERS